MIRNGPPTRPVVNVFCCPTADSHFITFNIKMNDHKMTRRKIYCLTCTCNITMLVERVLWWFYTVTFNRYKKKGYKLYRNLYWIVCPGIDFKSIKYRLCNYYFITTLILKLDSHFVVALIVFFFYGHKKHKSYGSAATSYDPSFIYFRCS